MGANTLHSGHFPDLGHFLSSVACHFFLSGMNQRSIIVSELIFPEFGALFDQCEGTVVVIGKLKRNMYLKTYELKTRNVDIFHGSPIPFALFLKVVQKHDPISVVETQTIQNNSQTDLKNTG